MGTADELIFSAMNRPISRHCEEQSDAAIQQATGEELDCFVAKWLLAMTGKGRSQTLD